MNFCRILPRGWVAAVALLVVAGSAHAQGTAPGQYNWEEAGKRIQASSTVTPLGTDLFGEDVSLSNGALSFSETDVSLPGNNGLAVAFSRSYTVRNMKDVVTDNLLADWEVNAPNISGMFAPNWTAVVNGVVSENRCSAVAPPPQPNVPGVVLNDFWNSISINIPGGGEMLKVTPGVQQPADGATYHWVTQGNVHVSCLPTIKNGTGQGFLAITPDGTKYWFDWMAQYSEPNLKGVRADAGSGNPSVWQVARRRNVMYATRVEDRFGNRVDYTYTNAWNAPAKLTKIAATDGRQLTIAYNGSNHVSTVNDGSRTWTYGYATTPRGRKTLTQVTLPDGSKWQYGFVALTDAEIKYLDYSLGETVRTCTVAEIPQNYDATAVGTVTHPSGAVGTFTVSLVQHGRSLVPVDCGRVQSPYNDTNDDINNYGSSYYAWTLKQKRVAGPGLVTADWNYAYEPNFSYYRWPGTTMANPRCALANPLDCGKPPCLNDSCAQTSRTTIAGPNGQWERHSYGNTYLYNEGKLLTVERGTSPENILSRVTHTYNLLTTGRPYPTQLGSSIRMRPSDSWDAIRPNVTSITEQQGSLFKYRVDTFDAWARPVAVSRWSELTPGTISYSKVEQTVYEDNLVRWVLGQTKKITVDGIVVSESTYDSTTAQQLTYRAFGQLVHTLSYRADGTIATIKDGRNFVTTLSNWYRGVPQTVQFPDSTSRSATVSPLGWIMAETDENGFTTSYGYDSMGRVNQITYPANDGVAWAPTTVSMVQVAAAEYGLPAGHWRQVVSTGNARKETYFDALMRPRLVREYDAAAVAATSRFSVKDFDYDGRETFSAYPVATLSTIAGANQGVWSTYDPLGRVAAVSQDSEHGLLTTTTNYLPGFQTRTTNPRGYQTVAQFQVFDQPTMDAPTGITELAGAATEIYRDSFGRTLQLKRRSLDGSIQESRHYVYDAYGRLCKTIEPETGATVVNYDNAGNVAWSAAGLNLPNTAQASCTADRNFAYNSSGRRVDRTYDPRNRLVSLAFPDGNGNQTWTYTLDGLPASITTLNNGGTTSVINGYTYNKRRMLTGETSGMPGWYTWGIGYGYNANGHLASQSYPSGLSVNFAPNALGQATRAGSYATGVQYHPNGAVKQFTYGNGLVHTMVQNARLLPARSIDTGGALNHEYGYDPNGNVLATLDHNDGARSRWMAYDGLDRLTDAGSVVFGGDHWHRYTYDALDNLRSWKLAGVKDYAEYAYDVSVRRRHLLRSERT